MVKLIEQYFAGEQLDQVIKLVDLMRSSDNVNYEMGLICMKELGLYSRFIQMIREYYEKFIVFNKSQPTLEYYENMLLNFSFNTYLYDVLDENGFVSTWQMRYTFKMKQYGTIILPLFLSKLMTIDLGFSSSKIQKGVIVNGGDIGYPIGKCYSTHPIKNTPHTLQELIIGTVCQSKKEIETWGNEIPADISSLSIAALDITCVENLLDKFKKLTYLGIVIENEYDGSQVVFPDSVTTLKLNFGGQLQSNPNSMILINSINGLPNLEKLSLSNATPFGIFEEELKGFVWDSWYRQYKRKI